MASGNGSNLAAILDAIAGGRLAAEVVAVVSDRPKAYALERAAEREISTAVVPFRPYRESGKSREAYDADLAELVSSFAPDWVVLAGFLRILSPAFLDRFEGRVINLHPALPGDLPGLHAIRRAWEEAQAGTRSSTGVMVHVVVPEVDAGPVLGTARVTIDVDAGLEDLEARMHAAEHRLLVEVLAGLAVGGPSLDA